MVSFEIPKWGKREREVINIDTHEVSGMNGDLGTVGADLQPVQGRHVLAQAVMGKLLQ